MNADRCARIFLTPTPALESAVVKIAPLAWHRDLLALVSAWFIDEWPGWYGPGGRGDAAADLAAFAAAQTRLPLGLVAFDNRVPVGVAASSRSLCRRIGI